MSAVIAESVEINLPSGHVALVDAEDAPLVGLYSWRVSAIGGILYARRVVEPGTGESQYMHALLTGSALTDHANGNGLDNRRSNLRAATREQNAHNARVSRRNSSGFKGVSWNAHSQSWRARIGLGGKQKTLGYRKTAAEAALLYDEAARELHGEFATLNFPRPGEQPARRAA